MCCPVGSSENVTARACSPGLANTIFDGLKYLTIGNVSACVRATSRETNQMDPAQQHSQLWFQHLVRLTPRINTLGGAG